MTIAAFSVTVRSCDPQRSTCRERRRCFRLGRAFTLIELVLVLVIIGIMGAIAMPKYASAVSRYRADAAARRIASDLGYARSLAIATSTSTSVQFHCDTSTYQIAAVADPDHGGVFTVALANDPYLASFSSATAVSNAFIVTYNGYGIPTSTPTIVVTSGSTSRTVTIAPDIGTATVQ